MAEYYHGHGHGGRSMYSNTDECYDGGRHGSRREYSYTDEERRMPAADDYGYGARQTAVYADEYSRDAARGPENYKREEREHKNKERMGEVGALASGAFALYEGQRAKKDPANAQRHRIEEGVAAVAALGGGGYAYHEHNEQKEANYAAKEHSRRPQYSYSGN